MFKLTLTHNNKYSEIPQPNPMRWRIMLRDKKELISQSGLIRCRDFFNDLVAARVANKQPTNHLLQFQILCHQYPRL